MTYRASSLVVGLFLFACTACTGASNGTGAPTPVQQGEVVSPTSGLDVKAAIASATLGDEGCTGSTTAKGISSQSCAMPTDGGTSADRAGGGCGGGCRPSNVQLAFDGSAKGSPAAIELAEAVLLDAWTGARIATLTASNPTVWDAATSTYKAWDEKVAPSSEVKASYTLTSPEWSKLGDSYSTKYKLQITLRVDGAALILESGPLNREPFVAT